MKPKLECNTPIFQKQKEIALKINQICGGEIYINVESHIDRINVNGSVIETNELYINGIKNSLSTVFDVDIFNDSDNILAQFNNANSNANSNKIISKIGAILMNHNCKIV